MMKSPRYLFLAGIALFFWACGDGGTAGTCSNSADCGVGFDCVSGQCVTATIGGGGTGTGGGGPSAGDDCDSDADCPSNQECQALVCQGNPDMCTADTDCIRDWECRQEECVPPTCNTTAECPGGFSCVANECTPDTCVENLECPENYICRATACVVDTCATDADCPTTFSCISAQCAPNTCALDEDCPPNFNCDAGGTDTCIAAALCTVDADCEAGEICNQDGACEVPVPNSVTPDTIGPTINIRSPGPDSLQGAVIKIEVDINDNFHEVDPTSVVMLIQNRVGQAQFSQPLYQDVPGSSTYVTTFDTELLGNSRIVQRVPIQVSARDTAPDDDIHDGPNETVTGHEFLLDTTPPILSFQGRPRHGFKLDTDDMVECSTSFSPVGWNNVQHGNVFDPVPFSDPGDLTRSDLGLAFYARVITQDLPNGTAAVPKIVSGIAQEETTLYILDKDGIDYLVAQSESMVLPDVGGFCREVNPSIIPPAGSVSDIQPHHAAVMGMKPVDPGERLNFSDPTTGALAGCDVGGAADAAPDPVCLHTQPTAPQWAWVFNTTGKDPAIYVAGEVVGNFESPLCGGQPYDVNSFKVDGPACLVAAAEDGVGNKSVTEVIAICVDKDGVGGECAGFDPDATRAICQAGCTPGGDDAANTVVTLGTSTDPSALWDEEVAAGLIFLP